MITTALSVCLLGTGSLISGIFYTGQATPVSKEDADDFLWGVYQIYWGPDHFRGMLERSIGPFASPPELVMFYRDLGRPFPLGGCRIIDSIGAIPVISLELWRWERNPKNRLPEINEGLWDEFFHNWAVEAKQYGKPIFFRFGFEMNGDWFTWGNQPTAFIDAWKRVHRIFDEVDADNVLWVWAPNNVSIPRTTENRIELYYPGHDLVDWLGVDGYNFGDHHDQWHEWELFEAVFADCLSLFNREYPDKPIMIAEFGSAPGEPGQKAAWIRDADRRLRDHPRIRAAIWFNLDKTREGEPDWSLGSDPEALEAFNQTFARP